MSSKKESKTVAGSSTNDTFKSKWFEGDMSPITVKMICTEKEDGISSRTEYDNFCDGMVLEKEADHHEDSDDNPIMIMTMTTSVTMICRNQKLIAMMTINNTIQ